MIKFKKLKWSNVFSYGEKNELKLDDSALTQLLGKNGHGKSSIALILEEVLFNTNSKKIKKADVLNRYTKSKNYTIELEFEKDGVLYNISTTRTSSTGSVCLVRGNEDISSHTATGTYKQIEQILGFDSKTFAQIVYQSSVSSLEFLTAPDTARKKFLIDLLNLGKYTKASEVFKELSNATTKVVEATQTKLKTVEQWIAKYANEDLSETPTLVIPDSPTLLIKKVTLLTEELANIATTNKKISNNNTYKTILDGICLATPYQSPDISGLGGFQLRLAEINKELKDGKAIKCTGPTVKCPTCSQDMDNSVMFTRLQAFEAVKQDLEDEKVFLTDKISRLTEAQKDWAAHDKKVTEWEKYHALYDPSLPNKQLDADAISKDIKQTQDTIDVIEKEIADAVAKNKVIIARNSKVRVISEQMEEMDQDAKRLGEELILNMDELSKIQVLVKTFSNTGLVAYKIECLVKDLEALTNEYLSILANGRFQLAFVVVSDKLNVVITDNGRDISIEALSSGERARVNVATLLAIRKLMQALSNSRTNLLILDETISNLDPEGKEKLIEVLLDEKDLNTFLVAHDYSHPLLDKITVVKENNISRLE